MRNWIAALLFGLVIALVTWQVALVNTPRMLMSAATKRVAKGAGYNAMFAGPLATSDARTIVRPSPDLAYSSCPFDVTKGPVLIEVAPVPAPYWSLSVFDARTDVAFVRNNLQAAGQPIKVAIVAKGTAAPAGYEPVPVSGSRGVALLRILVPDRRQFAAIERARRASLCRPL